jgi:hypothetical protein
MALQNVLLLTFWLLAAAISVTYVSVRPQPALPGLSVSSQQDDVLSSRDRPSGSWGTYLPRPILTKQAPTVVAKAPSLERKQPTITNLQKQPVVPVPKVERTIPSTSEPSAIAEAASQKRGQEALFGAESDQLALKSIPPKASKAQPTAKLPSERKKVITERRKSRFARREAG